MKNYPVMFLFGLLLVGCSYNIGTLPKLTNSSTNFALTVQSHGDNNYYVPQLSDTPYYVAITVTNLSSEAGEINNIELTNTTEFTQITDSSYYPVNQNICTNGTSLSPNASCEILVTLNNPQQMSSANTALNIIDSNNNLYTHTIYKHPYAYIAGDFSQTYTSSPIISPVQQDNTHCGVNQDSECLILEYDLESGTIQNIAQTNWNINSIVADTNGILYVGGGFDTGYSNSSTIYGPTSSITQTLIMSLNPVVNNEIGDFMKDNGNESYPDDEIYAMGYYNNKIYMTGGFQNIANLSSNNFPIATYDFTNKTWSFALGDDSNNPNDAVTSMGFDVQGNLYLSGYYTNISNFINSSVNSDFSINQCTLNNNVYVCYNNASDYTYINSMISGQPALSISFDNLSNLYAAGGFSALGSNLGAIGSNDYIIGKFSTVSNNWSAITSGSSVAPDRPIGVVSPLMNSGGFYAAGWFSTIGGLGVNALETGQCGPASDQYSNGVNSCMLAKYDATTATWSKIFTTDGVINTFMVSSKITA